MRIGLKLTAAFLTIASMVAAAGFLAQFTGRELKQQIERLSQSAIRQMAATTEVSAGLYTDHLAAHRQIAARRRDGSGGLSSAESPTGLQGSDHRREVAEHDLSGPPGKAKPPPADAAEAELAELAAWQASPSWERLQQGLAEHHELMSRFRALLEKDVDAAEQFFHDRVARHLDAEVLPRLTAIREQAERESTRGIRNAERALAVADQRRGMLLVAAAAIAVSIGLFMSRSIGKPLDALQRAARDIGRGRFDTRVAVRSRDEIGTLAASLNQMAAELREKTVSKDYVDNIIHSMREMLIVADSDLRIRVVNPATCCELGYAGADLAGRPLADLFSVGNLFIDGELSPAAASGAEGSLRSESGTCIPVRFSAAEMRDETGRLEGVVCVALNVSRQKETEERLRGSLREKELLLKEVHHRVKNNLQIISSLLSLQAQELRDAEVVRLFEESQMRVRSMALIHEQLYRSNDLAHINFADYAQQLVDHLHQGFGSAAAAVTIRLDIEPIPLPLDYAIPCGMIVNELVANALEHAFPGGRAGEIRIGFVRDDGVCSLTVADNGVGMPEGRAAGETTSIGLKVVEALTRQIHGRLDRACRRGTAFTIQFDNPELHPAAAAEP